MAKTNFIKRSFNAGELSILMRDRDDQEKHLAGCETLENFFPLIYGAAQRRPGTEFIAAQKSNSAKGRVVPFEHSVDDTYILLFENQVIRFFKSGAQVFSPFGTEDLSDFDSASGDSSLVAHWKCDDNASNTTVVDGTVAGSHDGVASANTDTLTTTDESAAANSALDLDGNEIITVADHNDFTFGDGSNDSPFSILVYAQHTSTAANKVIISKFNEGGGAREWKFQINSNDFLRAEVIDETNNARGFVVTDNIISDGWHSFGFTYNGVGGSNAAAGIKIYVDRIEQKQSVATTESGYVAMSNQIVDVIIGRTTDVQDQWSEKVDNVAILNKELSPTEIASLTGGDSTTVFEVVSPYLTADLPALKFEQSADVMFITHPKYEPRRLSRFGDAVWLLAEEDIGTGPFRDQNTDLGKTISVAEIGGAGMVVGELVTLTAVGHTPFVAGTTAGHLPSGALFTSKSITGALYKLVYASENSSISALLDVTSEDDVSSTLTVPKGVTWDLTTTNTWGIAADSASVVLERSYDSETTFETVVVITSAANRNIVTSGTEEVADAIYRLRVSEASATSTQKCSIQFSIRDTSHIGIVEITSITSGQVAIGRVRVALGIASDETIAATHRWSEGSFSNFRGWPIDVTISAEERLSFAGNISEPLTTWGSVIGDFTDFKIGSNDDDAVIFTLVGTGQQNRIRWMLSKDTLVLGTVGGEHLLGASGDEEALTPTNVKAKLRTTYGSEDIAAILINQAVLFVQRGGKKIREFLFNFEDDAHKADDLTVFSNHITGDGILNMVYQRTPDPTLWCVRTDGQIPIMTYERDQNVFSWSRIVTRSGDEFESVAIIYGGARSEDEIWVTVKRSVNSSTVRYVERFFKRAMPSSLSDMKFLDSFITDTGGTTTVSGLGHLKGETVQVLGDGVVQAEASSGDFTVTSDGNITVPSGLTKVQAGLGYTSTLKPMKPEIANLGLATTKRSNRVIVNLFESIGGEIGPNTSNLESIPTGTSALFTGHKEISLPGGYSREGDIVIRQTEPLPLTVLSLTLDMGVSVD